MYHTLIAMNDGDLEDKGLSRLPWDPFLRFHAIYTSLKKQLEKRKRRSLPQSMSWSCHYYFRPLFSLLIEYRNGLVLIAIPVGHVSLKGMKCGVSR